MRIGGKDDFRGKNFSGLLACAAPRTPHPQISRRKLLLIATKPQNSRKFSPSKVSCYTVITPLNPKFLSLQSSFSLHMPLTHLYLHFCPSFDSKTEPMTTSSLNPLPTDDAFWRHQILAACYQLAQSVLKIGFALAERVGQGEVGQGEVGGSTSLPVEKPWSMTSGPFVCFLTQMGVENALFTL